MTYRSGRKLRLAALLATAASVVAGSLAVAAARATATPAGQPAHRASAPAADGAALAGALQRQLGTRTAGTYLDRSGAAVVTVTDEQTAAAVRAAGAVPKLVRRSAAELASVTTGLRRYAGTVGTAWSVDPGANQVVLTVTGEASGARLDALLATAARYGEAVRVERVPGTLRSLVSGGDTILTGGGRCSLGFNVRSGDGSTFFLTAGHCTNAGADWSTGGGEPIGTRAASSFPGDDWGVVRYTGAVPADGTVAEQDITAAADPTVGQTACRRGSTTGTHCGTVQAVNATVNYPEGTVTGLVGTDICAEPGDSGGPLFAGSTALGLTSGGSGDCRTGGITFFQPVTEPLGLFGLAVF